MNDCPYCHGIGWVCEAHPTKPWREVSDHEDACTCEECAGEPCDLCNPSDQDNPPRWPEMDTIFASVDPADEIVRRH